MRLLKKVEEIVKIGHDRHIWETPSNFIININGNNDGR